MKAGLFEFVLSENTKCCLWLFQSTSYSTEVKGYQDWLFGLGDEVSGHQIGEPCTESYVLDLYTLKEGSG